MSDRPLKPVVRRRPAQRVRDMPAPRRSASLTGSLFPRLAWPYRVLLAGLYRVGFRPWQLTALAFLTNLAVGAALVTDRYLLAGLLLIPAGLFDVFDGGVARLRGEESRMGALLDSVNDRLSDAVVFGALIFSLIGHGRATEAALALTALIVSFLVPHLRAEGEVAGLDMSAGLFQRLERYLALVIGLTVPGALLPVLAILTVLGTATALQRSGRAWRLLPRLRTPPRSEP
jgi:CDP-diacylglycerol---glycerol-3-phosphate 3-phosphatidyltransferase